MILFKAARAAKQVLLASLLAFVLVSCGSGSSSSSSPSAGDTTSSNETSGSETGGSEEVGQSDPNPNPNPNPGTGDIERNSVRQYTFNHSLWDHVSSQHTNTVTGYWIGEFALASGTTYGWNGQFGQFFDHGLPPRNFLGSDNSADVFPASTPDFATEEVFTEIFRSQVDIDNIIIMPPNFSQGLGNSLGITQNDPRRIIDWLQNEGQKAGIPIYIYEHWPEASSGNLNAAEWALYHEFTTGSYHQWFLWFQDALLEVYPNVDIRTIPVGPIIADILQNPAFTNIGSLSFTDFYEDNSPHGRPNLYFLAGLITYQAMYGQTVANNYSPPVDSFGGVSAEIADDFSAINAFVWERLNYYNANGVRIWP